MADVSHNQASHRFEALVDGHLAIADYRLDGDVITLTHTHVPPALRGRGIADDLARVAFDYARDHHLAVRPRCPFMAAWLRRHPEYQHLETA